MSEKICVNLEKLLKLTFESKGLELNEFDLVWLKTNIFSYKALPVQHFEEKLALVIQVFVDQARRPRIAGEPLIPIPSYLKSRVNNKATPPPNFYYFTELVYLYRQYSLAETEAIRTAVGPHLALLTAAGIDIDPLIGRGKPPEFAKLGLIQTLAAHFRHFSFDGYVMPSKFKVGRLRSKKDFVPMNEKRFTLLFAEVFGIGLSERSFEYLRGKKFHLNYSHPYFHQVMSLNMKVGQGRV